MPLPIAHGIVGASIVALVHPKADFKNWKPLLYGFLLANAPDLDFAFVFLFGWTHFHRSLTHSLFFAALVGAAFFVALRRRNWRVPLAFSLAYLSHTILDLTFTSAGVLLLAPFDNTVFSFKLIPFPQIAGFAAARMLFVSLVETVVFVPVLLAILLVKRTSR